MSKITVQHYVYNLNLTNAARKMGATEINYRTFCFDEIVQDKAIKLKEKWEGELVTVQIKALENLSQWRGAVKFAGYTIAYAFGRDSGAKLGDGAYMLSGKIKSGGSRINWCTDIEKGSIFRIKILKSMLKQAKKSEKWEVSEDLSILDDECEDVID